MSGNQSKIHKKKKKHEPLHHDIPNFSLEVHQGTNVKILVLHFLAYFFSYHESEHISAKMSQLFKFGLH